MTLSSSGSTFFSFFPKLLFQLYLSTQQFCLLVFQTLDAPGAELHPDAAFVSCLFLLPAAIALHGSQLDSMISLHLLLFTGHHMLQWERNAGFLPSGIFLGLLSRCSAAEVSAITQPCVLQEVRNITDPLPFNP